MSHTPHNKGQAHNLPYIERQLRLGREPQDLGGRKIGEGVCKAAYLFESVSGGFVVKLNAQQGYAGKAEKTPPKAITLYGARCPRTYKAGKYILQEYVKPVDKLKDFEREYPEAYAVYRALNTEEAHKKGVPYDIHRGNVGIDANGKLVVFDW